MNEKEVELVGLLEKVVAHYKLEVNLRIAGGWVRDKLLGKDSEDVDISIDTMTGKQFGDYIVQYYKLTDPQKDQLSLNIIKTNPDQSKHLETAVLNLCGIELNVNNLRTETYAQHSRIPLVRVAASPEEDAQRRDFTINTLFYNLRTREVEDWTGKGVEDLRKGTIRTPIDPEVTLLEDPLRALRAIRFAGLVNENVEGGPQAGSIFEEKLRETLKLKEIHVALHNKVSRERISKEIEKMVHLRNATLAFYFLKEFGLFPVVFGNSAFQWKESEVQLASQIIDKIFKKVLPLSLPYFERLGYELSSDLKTSLLMSAIVYPFVSHTLTQDSRLSLHDSHNIGKFIKRDMRMSNLKDHWTKRIIEYSIAFQNLHNYYSSKSDKNISEAFWENLHPLCDWLLDVHNPVWISIIFLAVVHAEQHNQHQDYYSSHTNFINAVFKDNLQMIWTIPPVLNGDELVELFKEGPLIGEAKRIVLDWQIGKIQEMFYHQKTFLPELFMPESLKQEAKNTITNWHQNKINQSS
eukprot:TRINITY_DN11929_c0_g1_i2.p1 TRINITY_DN11929_c0_g1~~TRINITY_DN11929_c0_g1_i2.p1  ORF type:complete len:543 (-),score=143.40 TRINITY_DN11929_c0_g1_i2:6-1571(-)